MIASALSSLAGRRRGFPWGVTGVRAMRAGRTPSGSAMTSTAARVTWKLAARPGGFGNADRVLAGLDEARGTNHDMTQRRVRAGPSPLPR